MQEPRSKEVVLTEFRIQSILEATMRVIAREGLPGTSMNAIAQEAGIAKGTIYLYFRDREELIERVAQATFQELLDELDEVFAAPAAFHERFVRLVEKLFGFFDGRREFFRLLFSIRYPDGPRSAECRRAESPHYRRYLEQLSGFLGSAVASGEVMLCDPERLALFLSEGLHALLQRRLREETSPPAGEEVAWLTRVLLGGLLTAEEKVR
ncbi:MAG TPA: helix-turn-helix domain-containing protein [Thermoanaerobaculia bacterium]|nr:helix-turn-helix domain-containing protein [Thermoanaerobaculia bacterium]